MGNWMVLLCVYVCVWGGGVIFFGGGALILTQAACTVNVTFGGN